MASELPHKGYLRRCGSTWATCVDKMAQRSRGSYAQKPTETPGRRVIFGKTSSPQLGPAAGGGVERTGDVGIALREAAVTAIVARGRAADFG